MLIRVIDFETTGYPPEGRICEVGWCDVFNGPVATPHASSFLVDPGHPIPPEAQSVHHISDADVNGCATPEEGFRALLEYPPDAFAAHNANFERAFFDGGGLPWICTYKVALRLWPDAPSHSNQVLRYWLDVDSDGGFRRQLAMPPHRAFPDAYVSAFILSRTLELASVADMIAWSAEPALLPTVQFGKHFGKRWEDLPIDYLEWIVKQDFDEDVMHTARHHIALRREGRAHV